MSEWISVKDRLPERLEAVLGYMPNLAPCPVVHECFLDSRGDWYVPIAFREKKLMVTHWMPLPEPPKEKEKVGFSMQKELKITFTIHDDNTAKTITEINDLDVVEVACGTIAIIQSLQQEISRGCKRGSRSVALYNSLIKRFVNDDNAPSFIGEDRE